MTTRIEFYKDTAGEWRWRAKAGNGETVADSGEGYKNHGDALAIAKALFPDAEIAVEIVNPEADQ